MTNPGNALGTNGGYNGRTSVNAFNDILSAFSGRGIVNGWECRPKSGMTVSLGGQDLVRDFAIAVNDIGQSTSLDNISTQPIDVTLSDAPTLGSRIDVIVGYVTNPPNSNDKLIDSPDACGLIVVESSVTTNPVAPDEAMIREAITADGGSGVNAYYVVFATIQVGTGVTTITNTEITQGEKARISSNIIPALSPTDIDVAALFNYAGNNQLNFGLGGDAINISHTDVNNLPDKSGLYSGWSLTNAPTNSHYHILQIVKSGYKLQVAYSAYSNELVYQRIYDSPKGTWSSWTRLSTPQLTLDQCYPVGSVYISATLDTPAKVAAALGGGTWVSTSVGHTLVGFTSSDNDFNQNGKTGGEKTVKLVNQHLPSEVWTSGYTGVPGGASSYTTNTAFNRGSDMGMYNGLKNQIGHNNMPPYLVRYIYQRTA